MRSDKLVELLYCNIMLVVLQDKLGMLTCQ